MADWKKTQYRVGPPPSDESDLWTWENMKYGVGGWIVVGVLIACIAAALVGLFGAF